MFGFLFFLTMVYCWRGKVGCEARNQADWICFLLGRWLSEFLVTDCQSHLYKGDESKWTRSLVDRVPKTALFTQVTYKGQSFPFCVSDGGSFHLSILKRSGSSNGLWSHIGTCLPPWFLLLFFILLLYYSSDLCVWKHQIQFPTETYSGNFIFPSSFIFFSLFLLLFLFIIRSMASA